MMNNWPRQSGVSGFYGKVGQNQTRLHMPYPLKLAWDTNVVLNGFSCHEKVKDSALRVFDKVLDHYGLIEIKRLRLDLFGGCLNVRKMRGGSAWSMHSWGIAIDMDPDKNAFRMNKKQASFSKKEYDFWWEAWEEEGWTSLGRKRDFDWMHVQAASL